MRQTVVNGSDMRGLAALRLLQPLRHNPGLSAHELTDGKEAATMTSTANQRNAHPLSQSAH